MYKDWQDILPKVEKEKRNEDILDKIMRGARNLAIYECLLALGKAEKEGKIEVRK